MKKPETKYLYSAILGRVIRQRRELLGISLEEMALHLGFQSSSGWSRGETGNTPMTVEHLAGAATMLGSSPMELVKAADDLKHELAGRLLRKKGKKR